MDEEVVTDEQSVSVQSDTDLAALLEADLVSLEMELAALEANFL